MLGIDETGLLSILVLIPSIAKDRPSLQYSVCAPQHLGHRFGIGL